jgi:hypothetical protein
MHAPKVARGVVAFIVPLACLASFAVCKKGLVRGSVDGNPDLARLSVDSVGVTS